MDDRDEADNNPAEVGHYEMDTIVSCSRVTSDNDCEFCSQKKLDKFFGKVVYFARAYAAWEKGCIENCNRIVRRWYPKGTDFSKGSNADVKKLMDRINSIHRASLEGATAFE